MDDIPVDRSASVPQPVSDVRTIELAVEPITAAAFAPYGTLIEPADDGKPFGDDEAQLVLDRGQPRFYIMNLPGREMTFGQITRHLQVTQCLASVGGERWVIAVAPPDQPEDRGATPDLARLRAFSVDGARAVMLRRGTWHAGPYFEGDMLAFFNLELADTNQRDHVNAYLERDEGLRYRLVVRSPGP